VGKVKCSAGFSLDVGGNRVAIPTLLSAGKRPPEVRDKNGKSPTQVRTRGFFFVVTMGEASKGKKNRN